MKLQDFHVEIADWSRAEQRSALLDLREAASARKPGTHGRRESDDLDGECWHLLARDEAGAPIGGGRLGPGQRIGRMAVLPAWRGRGVGSALLRELLGRARTLGWSEVTLDAPADAIGFYERAGFVAHGEPFEDAGLPQRAMRLALATADAAPPPRDTVSLPTGSAGETAAARLQLLADTRHQLCIRLPRLEPDGYASAEELAELRRIATSGRAAQIRILLHDPEAALRSDHRLVALAQRLSSTIRIRTPVDEVDLAWASTCLLNDAGGYLFLPDASRPQGRASRHDRPEQAPLQQHFDEVWERSEPARVLQALDL